MFATGERKIEPFEDSINFDGNIYALQNENIYSFFEVWQPFESSHQKIHTVSQHTGILLGRGINQEVFEFSNSRIIYRLERVIDFLNVSKSSDVFHDKVEIPVTLTLENY